jgi:hypothetical protein
MRIVHLLILLAPLAVAACGTTEERTVVVNPAPGQSVVVPPAGQPRVCQQGVDC